MAGSVVHVADLNWNVAAIAHAMGLSQAGISDCLKDGRSAVFFVSRKLEVLVPGYKIVPSAQTKHALTDGNHDVWAVKCVTPHGIDFSKSKMRGVGRQFDQAEFDKMMANLAGFFVADIVDFPRVPVWQVGKDTIQAVLKSKNITGGAISRNEILHLIQHHLKKP
jgi:hypothetical protein